MLVEPIRDRIGDGPLVVVPSGSLAGVPWSLLPELIGRPLTVPRSASGWLADHEEHFRLDLGRLRRRAAGRSRRRGGGSRQYGLDDSGGGPRRRRLGTFGASTSRLGSTCFHAAAHGRHSADNPLFSGLELVDGPWFGYDIDQLAAIPSTVVLSACEVGRSSVRWGEETIGMTVAWLHAGARCVIASPALVNDDTACELLAATHAALAAGAEPSMALASASRSLDLEAPAPFVCFGNGW